MDRTLSMRTAWTVGVLALAAGCVAEPIVSPENTIWVTTLVDSTTTSLSTASTFAVPDTVVELKGDGVISHVADHDIVEHVREHFLALGWTEVRDATAGPPDVLVVIGAMTKVEVGVSYTTWYGAWGWLPYWGVADPSWIWGAPVGAIPYVYEVGTLVLTMVDLRAPRATTKRVPLLWVAAVNAVLSGDVTLPRALAGIDQAFAQSPYLRVE